MKVSDLIEKLKALPPEAPVHCEFADLGVGGNVMGSVEEIAVQPNGEVVLFDPAKVC